MLEQLPRLVVETLRKAEKPKSQEDRKVCPAVQHSEFFSCPLKFVENPTDSRAEYNNCVTRISMRTDGKGRFGGWLVRRPLSGP